MLQPLTSYERGLLATVIDCLRKVVRVEFYSEFNISCTTEYVRNCKVETDVISTMKCGKTTSLNLDASSSDAVNSFATVSLNKFSCFNKVTFFMFIQKSYNHLGDAVVLACTEEVNLHITRLRRIVSCNIIVTDYNFTRITYSLRCDAEVTCIVNGALEYELEVFLQAYQRFSNP